jgi:hypothetical protein
MNLRYRNVYNGRKGIFRGFSYANTRQVRVVRARDERWKFIGVETICFNYPDDAVVVFFEPKP